MELEEAKKILKIASGKVKGLHVYQDTLTKAIECILSALDNSISKDEIKEKQQKLYDKAREEEGFIYNHIDEYYYATEILQELLNKGE